MMSSLASVLVANANATPENVVPYSNVSIDTSHFTERTHKIDADNKLSLATVAALDLSHRVLSVVLGRHRRAAVAVRRVLYGLMLHRVPWRRIRLRLVHVLRCMALRRVAVATAGVDRWWRHWTTRSTLVRMLRRTEVSSLICVLV